VVCINRSGDTISPAPRGSFMNLSRAA